MTFGWSVRSVRITLDPGANLIAIEFARHHHVKKYQVRLELLRQAPRLTAVVGSVNLSAINVLQRQA